VSGGIGHRLWQTLPRGLRRRAAFGLGNAFAPRAQNVKLKPGAPVTIAGFLETPSGLGQSARAMRDVLKQLHYDVRSHSFSGRLKQPRALPVERSRAPDWAKPGAVVVHINPPLLSLALAQLRGKLEHQRIIGYWAWELPELPDDWVSGFSLVDEIWCPSEFTAEAVRRRTKKPVHVVPHFVPVDEDPPAKSANREFTVFTAFDMGSSFARKNPLGVVDAFRRAFANGEAARLIVKISNPEAHPESMAALAQAAAGDARIAFNTAKLSGEAMLALVAASDVVMSLHRSEGFGLVLAEAMAAAVPVIATGWSGNRDFMHEENSLLVPYTLTPAIDPQRHYHFPAQSWAAADIEAAAQALRFLFGNKEARLRLGVSGQETVRAALSLDRLRMIYAARLYPR
jgi:glycosyltransferase involved in cell wall biosynthesis